MLGGAPCNSVPAYVDNVVPFVGADAAVAFYFDAPEVVH